MQENTQEFLARKYNHVLIKKSQRLESGDFNLALLKHGIVCDFAPTKTQIKQLKKLHEPINLKNTLFTYDQSISLDIQSKLKAQISEYILSYGFGGAFIRSKKKTIIDTRLLSGITDGELKTFIEKILASPVALRSEDIEPLSELVRGVLGPIDLNQVRNNELRVKLLAADLNKGRRPDNLAGEDLIRYIVMTYTDSTLLIKSQKVLSEIRQSQDDKVNPQILFDYAEILAVCFNRFKPILLALRKSPASKKAINKISHLSKRLHEPVGMPPSRTFIADFLKGDYAKQPPRHFSIYDWFRILNAIKVQLTRMDNDVFQIRNGKIWYQPRKTRFPDARLIDAETYALARIIEKISHLKDENIKLPKHIRLGLPITEKQSIGALPFGSVISTGHISKEISVGIYWENAWGANDLDLSMIDLSGQRTGWGDAQSYQREDIQFSGDITNAPEGAMEFMTTDRPASFGLFVNIFSGKMGSECKLVIGSRDIHNKQWIDNIYIGEKTRLESRNNLIGFLNANHEYIVYQGRLGGGDTSSPKNKAVVAWALASLWTLDSLFEAAGITYDPSREATIDLSYDGLTFNSLAEIFTAG